VADDFAAVRKWMQKVEGIAKGDALRRVLNEAGKAGKKAALDAAGDSLGGDLRFRNMARGGPLSAGYDPGSETTSSVVFRGPWRLAEGGRKKSGSIYRRGVTSTTGRSRKGNARAFRGLSFSGGQHAPAIRTPDGPRAHSRYGPSRGLKTYSNATRKASVTVPKAAHDQWTEEIRRAMG
jgi:hypothetical protein